MSAQTNSVTETDNVINENELDELSFEDEDPFANKPVDSREFVECILKYPLFAFSSETNECIALKVSDWAEVARLYESGMDRVFVFGKEVFCCGYGELALKTNRNIDIVARQLKERGLEHYKKILSLA